jgi:uncharacterized protein (TIGR02145 family)
MNTPFRILAIAITCSLFAACGSGSGDKPTATGQTSNDTVKSEQATTPAPPPAPAVPTIKIGEQEWMTADISATTYNNGDAISEAALAKQWSAYAAKKEGCYRKLENGTVLYNGYAMTDARGLVPTGFQVPSKDDFNKLIKFLGGGESKDGRASIAMSGYDLPSAEWNEGGDGGDFIDVMVKGKGKRGFNAREGGFVYDNGETVWYNGICSFWWTSTSKGGDYAVVDIGYCSQDLGGGNSTCSAGYGCAVRGIKK